MKNFLTKREALAYLVANAMACVTWGNGKECAIYWNGRLSVQPTEQKKEWA